LQRANTHASFRRCFQSEKFKFETTRLIELAGEVVTPVRVEECRIRMEARVRHLHKMGGEQLEQLGGGIATEVEILRVHASAAFIKGDKYINPKMVAADL
jgi:flavin reductase (DIM6/NTAB) family NADH-FMN oxidoreductase RutF